MLFIKFSGKAFFIANSAKTKFNKTQNLIILKSSKNRVSLNLSYPSVDAQKDNRTCVFLVYACYKNLLFLSAGGSLLNSTRSFFSHFCTRYVHVLFIAESRGKTPAGCTVSCFISNFVEISSLITSENWRVIPGSRKICFLFSHNGRKIDSGRVINRLKSSFTIQRTTVHRQIESVCP